MQRPGRTKRLPRTIEPTPPAPAASPASPAFDVVALVTSAGGLEALAAILGKLPDDFPAPVVVSQHLGGQGSALVDILSRRTTLRVTWASAGARLTAGHILVCPPRRQLEILPDGTCAIGPETAARDKPLDLLLESIADSYGPRALAAVLTGMGRDAAVGAGAVKRSGGIVLVQSVETSEQPSMPMGTIVSGAADLILPLQEIAGVIVGLVSGGEVPRPRAEVEAAEELFAGDGEVSQLLRAIDWSRTPLGPVTGWPVTLRTMVRLVLDSRMPMSVLWGPDLMQIYNDPYRLVMGPWLAAGLGQPGQVGFPESWHLNQPIFQRVLSGESVTLTDARYPVSRRDGPEDAWLDLNFTPVRDGTGAVAGVHVTAVETTSRVLSKRRLRTLQALTATAAGATNVPAAMHRALGALGGGNGSDGSGQDVPFALAYLVDDRSRQAQLAAFTGVDAGGPMAPRTIDLRAGQPAWPLARVLAEDGGRAPLLLTELAARFPGCRPGPAREAPSAALLMPLRPVADEPPTGVLVCGINPRLVLDETYRGFLELVAAGVGAALAEAQVRQKEHVRLQRLADLDRVKTEFFSNVSHEFRTPLTLLLGPLEELTRREAQLPQPLGEEIQIAARNARRLLNQVNTLLDFSQLEARRLRPRFEETDLAALTRDIASVFRSAAERAGLRLRVECPPLGEPVWVDPQMWERIVSNLLSNALKFTFTGEITVGLRAQARHAELIVQDTGLGIPADEQPHVFKRFHRVRGRRGRTGEGSGIGLAMVDELVRLHHGRVRVNSEDGHGSTFTAWVPMGRRLEVEPALEPAASTPPAPTPARTPEIAAALAEEAASWSNGANQGDGDWPAVPGEVAVDLLGPPRPPLAPAGRCRILVVDDNADMRDYLRRLLEAQADVTLASEGDAALTLARALRPDVIVADVMMPGLDGFELLTLMRADAELQYTPFILVTAHAGEEAAIEGLRAGADDYVAKPFSARELVARVHAVIARSRVEAAMRERGAWLRGQREALTAAVDGAPLAVSLGTLVRTATEALGQGTRAAFYLADPQGTALHHVIGMSDEYAAALDGFRIGPESLACGMATATGQAILTTDVMTDPVWEPWRWMARRFDYRGCWSFPIHTSAEKFLGTFAVYAQEPREATARDLELASLLTGTASIIISRHAESTARKQAEDALTADLAGMRRLHELHARLLNETNLQAALEEILATAVAVANTDRGTIQLLRPDTGGRLEIVAAHGYGQNSRFLEHFRLEGFKDGRDPANPQRTRLVIEDTRTFPGLAGTLEGEAAAADEILAAQSTPMITRPGELVGVLSTQYRRPGRPSEDELRLMDLLAWTAAAFVERHRVDLALRSSRADALRQLADAMERQQEMANVPGIGTLTLDVASGTLLDANDAFLTMTGYTRGQIERRELTWQRMTPPST